MLALPFIGPILTWIAGPFLSFAKGLGDNLGVLAVAAFKNPYVLGALVAAAFFLLYHHEEGRVSKVTAAAAKNDATWAAAFAQERKSFAVADGALKGQNAAVEALWAAGRPKLKASAQIAAAAGPAHAKATSEAAAILAAPKGATDCAAAQATFDAARKALR
jgi:hypothetical protein